MTMSPVHSAQSATPYRGQTGGSQQFADFMVGQTISIKVQRRLDEQHYVVLIRGNATQVRSEHSLPVGETIDAVVVNTANKLELRQVATHQPGVSGDKETTAAAALANLLSLSDVTDVASQANFYKCTLSDTELATLQAAADAASDPSSMTLAGLFLSKRGISLEPAVLQQLYAMQTRAPEQVRGPVDGANAQNATGAPLTIGQLAQVFASTLEGEDTTQLTRAAHVRDAAVNNDDKTEKRTLNGLTNGEVGTVLTVPGEQASTSDAGGDRNSRDQAFALLNQVDVDGLGVRYGTVPVLVDGRLVELELMLFQHRQQDTDVEPVRRLVMSINTSTLGTVSITAEALNNRLLINISADTSEHVEALGDYAAEVRQLAERFGWGVDSVSYEVQTGGATLARRVIEHTVRQGAVDHVW